MPPVRLVNLTKKFKEVTAVDHINLEVKHGEILTLLGPSGCGKTTTLRMIAGLLIPDEGEVYIGDTDVTHLPPEKRNIGMVFQSYALWPHMTVFDNIAFGLKLRKLPKSDIRSKVKEVLELVRLEGFENRYPRQLSGGQQQRVALARALVLEPQVLLLDEPLSNLDAKLREEMRFEIRDLQRKLSITTIYVTHDQAEALALSDRIAIMNQGKIMQVGKPEDIYEKPANVFVASFIGIGNFIEGVVEKIDDNTALVRTEEGLMLKAQSINVTKGDKVKVLVRPSHIRLAEGETQDNVFEATILKKTYLGDEIDYRITIGNNTLRMILPNDINFKVNEKIRIWLDPKKIMALKG